MREDQDLNDLIRAAARGDQEAFAALVVMKRERVVRTAYQIVGDMEDARDVAQGVFLRLWRVLQRFDLERRFDTWLYRITVNAAIDYIRERGPKGVLQPLPEDGGAEVPSREPGADELVDRERLQRTFLRLAAKLAPKQRAVFVLKEIEGLDTDEVARVLEISESTVRNHLHQARKILREAILREHPEWS